MDTSVYSDYRLVRGTLDFVRRVKRDNPVLWAQIQAEIAQKKMEEVTENGKETLPR